MSSVAAATREAVRERPCLLVALRAGVVNHAAAAEFLDVDGDADSVATALRRFAADLPDLDPESRDARVTMRSGVGLVDDWEADEALFRVAGAGVLPDAGSLTAVIAAGDVDAAALTAVLGRLRTAGVAVEAAGVAGDALLVVVSRRDGARAVRAVESALEAVAV